MSSFGLSIEKYSPEEEKIPEYSFSEYKAVILSGSPMFVSEFSNSKAFEWLREEILHNKEIPILGICFGMQLIHSVFKGTLSSEMGAGLGKLVILREREHALFKNIRQKFEVWASFTEVVKKLGIGFYSLGSSEKRCMLSAHVSRPLYTVQYHPELYESEFGVQLLRNFLELAQFEIKENIKIDINEIMGEELESLKREYKGKLKGKKVLIALSGGVDSSVLAYFLLEIMFEENLYPIFISTGLCPAEKEEKIISFFEKKFLNFKVIRWGDRIFENLRGVKHGEEKRKIIAKLYWESLSTELKKLGSKDEVFFAQGSVLSDKIESGKNSSNSENIKSHHNFLREKEIPPEQIIEPFSNFFKDQVRLFGSKLNLPVLLLSNQPFPGPGLAIRVSGEVTREKVELLSKIQLFLESEFKAKNLERYSSQYFPILLSEKAVGVKGDCRKLGEVIVIRSIKTKDYMSAEVSNLFMNELITISNRLISAFPAIGRVLYDLTSKPPGTIEWE